ncbi:hypothetical protein ACSFXN_14895 [Planococcus sp. 1R117A]|uniref:hypothetical protein n=1 Tax=Planococcus sp. 1R117A TaxID=3447020 RepID=UPI003EDC2336
MISEIKGKISRSGSNLTDRLEDKLTGDFFGALRYLPFEQGLKGILQQVKFAEEKDQNEWLTLLDLQSSYKLDYKFWPKHPKGEIDLMLEFDDLLVGIEVKYKSGISSEDDAEVKKVIDYKDSLHQLSKYSHMLEERAGNRKCYLLFLAPFAIQYQVQQKLNVTYEISPAVKMGYTIWEDLHTALIWMTKTAQQGAQQLVLTDAKELLEVKGLKRFSGFVNFTAFYEIQHTPYIYESDKALPSSAWSWPEMQSSEEDQPYVYSTY